MLKLILTLICPTLHLILRRFNNGRNVSYGILDEVAVVDEVVRDNHEEWLYFVI